MRIALDYDKTYTLDPVFWANVIREARARGHTVDIVTMRHDNEDERLADMPVPVIYTGRKAKQKFFSADVWIDDTPQWILADSD